MIKEFAEHCKKEGFKVYLSKDEKFGCYTDSLGLRVAHFENRGVKGVCLFGCLKGGESYGSNWLIRDWASLTVKHWLKKYLYSEKPHEGCEYISISEYLKSYKILDYVEI